MLTADDYTVKDVKECVEWYEKQGWFFASRPNREKVVLRWLKYFFEDREVTAYDFYKFSFIVLCLHQYD